MDFQKMQFQFLKKLCYLIFLVTLVGNFTSCKGQTNTISQTKVFAKKKKLVGGGCDGCELMYVGMPKNITARDTSAGWTEKGQKLLITGTVYKLGGKIPAPNVIIYYWQTDNNGYYSPKAGMDERAKRHGHIRGWVKTDENGNYSIYTIRPSPYPNRDAPAHIHIAIKEPNIDDEYYIDSFVFSDDRLLTRKKREQFKNRGGSGILRVLIDGAMQIAEHNIVLGLNIPNYPKDNPNKLKSGLEIGEEIPSFSPYHAFGPDKGTTTCPVCKYGRFHGILYFVGNKPNWDKIKKWLFFLESESVRRSHYLKVYFVYGNSVDYSKRNRKKVLEELGNELQLEHTALTFVPSFHDIESEIRLNRINQEVKNTFIIYRHRTMVDKFVDLEPIEENYKRISKTLDYTKSKYFNLPEPKYH